MVLVGVPFRALRDELVPRHAPHRIEHAVVLDAAAGELLLDHPLAFGGEFPVRTAY
jgi:hypothetical protein